MTCLLYALFLTELRLSTKARLSSCLRQKSFFRHPLHPYTKALLSAVPTPDPEVEKKKKLLVYDPSVHDYSVDKPVWEEILSPDTLFTEISVSLNSTETRLQNLSNIKKKLPDQCGFFFSLFGKS